MPNPEHLTQIHGAGEPASPVTATTNVVANNALTRSQLRTLAVLTAVLFCCFAKPLYGLFRFAIHSDLFSHTLLVPFITGYLIWIKKESLPSPSRPARMLAAMPLVAGLLVYGIAWSCLHSANTAARSDYLTFSTLSFVLLFVAACFFSFGLSTLRALVFPLCFLIFTVPFPGILTNWIETFLQYSSALVAHLFFTVSGMSFFRNGLFFQLPGMRLEVAPECSGIHSTLVLFITSLVAGQLFLRKFSSRALFALAVIPLGIIRNAFRIWVIGELCVHISPEMIDSPIHRRGGPIFFLITLVPLFLLLYYQRRSELKNASRTT